MPSGVYERKRKPTDVAATDVAANETAAIGTVSNGTNKMDSTRSFMQGRPPRLFYLRGEVWTHVRTSRDVGNKPVYIRMYKSPLIARTYNELRQTGAIKL